MLAQELGLEVGLAVGMDAMPKDLQVVGRCCLLCVEHVDVDMVVLGGGPRMDCARAFQRDRILNRQLRGFAHVWG